MQFQPSRRLPPGPKGIPLFGVLFDYNQDPTGFSLRCAQEFGDITLLPFGPLKVYLLANPEHVSEVLNHKSHCFVKGVSIQSLKSSLGEGLLTSEGNFWKRQRRLTQPAFHRERLAGYGDIMTAAAETTMRQWQDGEIRDIHADMMQLTLLIVAQSLFGTDIADKTPIIESALDAVLVHFSNQLNTFFLLPEWVPTPDNIQFWQKLHQMDEVIYDIIRQRRLAKEAKSDLLTMLLQLETEDGDHMSDREIRDEVVTLMMAGHETTALALTWTWMLLAQHSEVEEKLCEEIKTVLQGRSPTAADVSQLTYANWVLKESMRLYPPAWGTSRQVIETIKLGDYTLEPGDTVFVNQWVMHRDPRFFERPEQFQPERWADGFEQRLPKGVYFPFGDGPRGCIGKGFAMMESVLLLVAIAQKFRLTLDHQHPIELQPSITLRPKFCMKMCLQKREIKFERPST